MSSWPTVRQDAVGLPVDDASGQSVPAPGHEAVDDLGRHRSVPGPRVAYEQAAPTERPRHAAATAVLPYVSSRASTRTRGLRAWMLTAPVDLVALLAPLLLKATATGAAPCSRPG